MFQNLVMSKMRILFKKFGKNFINSKILSREILLTEIWLQNFYVFHNSLQKFPKTMENFKSV